jgi:hypothetical protein
MLAIPLVAFSYALPAELNNQWSRYIIFCSALVLPLLIVFFVKESVPKFPKAALILIYLTILGLSFEHESFYSLINQLISVEVISLEVVARFVGQALSIAGLIGAVAVLMAGLVQVTLALFNKDKSVSWSPAFQSLTPILIIFILGLSLRFIDSLIVESHNLF